MPVAESLNGTFVGAEERERTEWEDGEEGSEW